MKLLRKLVCRVRGHRLEQHILYLPGEVLTADRCRRCTEVVRSSEATAPRYPRPARTREVRPL